MDGDQTVETMQDRKHRFALAEVQNAAFKLFLEKGYDGTTVDEIATAAGISRRTFFRYYETKEDVMMAALQQSGAFLDELIAKRPDDEHPLTTMKFAMSEFLSFYQRTDPNSWRILDLIQSTPRLRARFLLERQSWLPRLTAVLESRSRDRNHAEIAAYTSLALLTYAYERWHQDQEIDAGQVVIDAFETLATLRP
jgi:AcrR family transcriptional regulator